MSDEIKNRKQGRGRPLVYKDESERRAARALAAQKRRAAMKE